MLAKKIITSLVLAVAAVQMTSVSAAMASGPEMRVIVVYVTDGSNDPVNLGKLDQLGVDVFVRVDQAGISIGGIAKSPDGNALGGWGVDPEGINADQRDNGDTAAGLRSANRNCRNHAFCHVVLVNYRQPESRHHRVAAKLAADELKTSGHRLHAVAIGDQAGSRHLGFNWYLSGQAFSASPDGATEAVSRMAHYAKVVSYVAIGESATSNTFAYQEWSSLSYIEKIWLNPLDCNLETQWLWAYDATCHDKLEVSGISAD